MEVRVKAAIWVAMALRLSAIAGRPGAVLRRGDEDAGGIIVLLRGRSGFMVLTQIRDGEGRPAWLRASGATPVGEEAATAYVERQIRRDPDLWVVEFEAPDFLPPFEARLV